MTQILNIITGIVASSSIGLQFGLWMNNMYAGLFACLVTFVAFMFKYDND